MPSGATAASPICIYAAERRGTRCASSRSRGSRSVPRCRTPPVTTDCAETMCSGRRTPSRILSWAHTFDTEAVLTSSLLYHYNRADYDGGAGDYPHQHHRSALARQYEGAEEESAGAARAAIISMSAFCGFAQQDRRILQPALQRRQRAGARGAPFSRAAGSPAHACRTPSRRRTGCRSSAGVRQTHFQGNVTENATDPRLGTGGDPAASRLGADRLLGQVLPGAAARDALGAPGRIRDQQRHRLPAAARRAR